MGVQELSVVAVQKSRLLKLFSNVFFAKCWNSCSKYDLVNIIFDFDDEPTFGNFNLGESDLRRFCFLYREAHLKLDRRLGGWGEGKRKSVKRFEGKGKM